MLATVEGIIVKAVMFCLFNFLAFYRLDIYHLNLDETDIEDKDFDIL